MGWRFIAVVAGVFLASLSFGQGIFFGYHEYPQFRSLMALPGSGMPISPDGHIDWNGAMTLSTPVGYGLNTGVWVVGLSSTSRNLDFRFPRRHREDLVEGNGGAQLMTGIDLGKAGRLTPGMLVLSGVGDTAFNLQWSAPPVEENLYMAVGIVDITGGGGSSGPDVRGDGDSSTSLYAVVTRPIESNGAHLSIGLGTKRYNGIFANGSINLAPMLKGYVEYDTFNVNAGVGWLVRTRQRDRTMVLQFGVQDGRYLNTTLNFSF